MPCSCCDSFGQRASAHSFDQECMMQPLSDKDMDAMHDAVDLLTSGQMYDDWVNEGKTPEPSLDQIFDSAEDMYSYSE